jgi:hypothetical protein
MSETDRLLKPSHCSLLLIDHQAGLAFGVSSVDRQTLLNDTVAMARTAKVFSIPVILSTSASKVYSGSLMPLVHAVLPDAPVVERRRMSVWEDDGASDAVVKTGRPRLLMSDLPTDAYVSFAALCSGSRLRGVCLRGCLWRIDGGRLRPCASTHGRSRRPKTFWLHMLL